EIMDPTAVGFSSNSLVIGKHSGRAAFKHTLARIGVELSDSDFDRVFNRMKQVADQNGALGDARIRSIVEEVVSDSQVMQAINQGFCLRDTRCAWALETGQVPRWWPRP